MLPEFEFWIPQTLQEALARMAEGGAVAMPVAGGTNVIPDLRSGRHASKIVVDLSHLSELHGIRLENGYLTAGAGVTISELLASPLIHEHARPLEQAARLFANPLIRNRATLGGNLVDASPAADTAPPLLALDAEIDLMSSSGCRTLPLREFFLGVRKTARRAEELLVAVRWPVPGPQTAFAYYKLGLRKADAISVVSAAVRLDADEQGRCRSARIALGSVAPVPLRAIPAEESLAGQPLSEEVFAQAAARAIKTVWPISDLRGSAAYRQKMVSVLVARLLGQAAAELRKAG